MPVGKENLTPDFYKSFVQMAQGVGIKPEDALNFMVSESGLSSNSFEPKFRGGGLIALMPDQQKAMGFKGSPEEFAQLSAVQQLPFVQKQLRNMAATVGNNKSAAGLYTYNFWPAAFKLPGIQAQDPKTAFIERNPQATSRGISKKYADVGLNITAKFESQAYAANKVFDKDNKGYISYGDMQRQVAANTQNPIYQRALKAMNASTGYIASTVSNAVDTVKDYAGKAVEKGKQMAESTTSTEDPSWLSMAWTGIKSLLDEFGIKLAFPEQKFLISIGSEDLSSGVKYANILATALEEYLQAENKICIENNNVELESIIHGDKDKLEAALKQFAGAVAEEFKQNTFIKVASDSTSSLPEISIEENEIHNRKFLLKAAAKNFSIKKASNDLTYSSALRELKKKKELAKIFKEKYKEVFDESLINGDDEVENNALSAAVNAVDQEDGEIFNKFDKNDLDDAVSTSRDSEFMDHAYYGLAPFTGDGEYPRGHIADVETTYPNRADYQISGILEDAESVDTIPEPAEYDSMSAANNFTGPRLGGGFTC